MRIGIIGQGFVGTAVREGLKKYHTIRTYDLDETKRNCDSIEELVDKSTVLFVCLPTPMNKDGSCNTDIVEGMVTELDNLALIRQCANRVVVIKSTIPPGTTEKLNEECKHIQVIFNPEFLTEANFIDDFKNQDRIIIGGPRPASTRVRQLFYKAFPKAHIIKTGSTTAEMVKYMTNTFLTTKVSFANEIYEICESLGVDYDKVTEYATYDERLGKSHWAVPGPDGDLGFGGHCLPKDVSAIVKEFGSELLKTVLEVNDKVRENKDWEEMKGRAVI